MVTKTYFDAKLSSLDSKIAENKTKNKSSDNELKKLRIFDSRYFICKSYFDEDGAQNYLVFQPIHRYFKTANTKCISSWKSEGLSEETIASYATSDNSLTPLIDHYGIKVRAKCYGACLKQSNKLTYSYEANVNINTVCELGAFGSNHNDPTIKNCLFGAVTLTQILKNMDILAMKLDLIEDQHFHFLVVDLVKMY